MPLEPHFSNHHAIQSEPVEAFGYRRFESAQDFPDPPPFTNTHNQLTYQSFEPNGGDNWVDGFLQSPPEPDEYFEELPETFVGMSTTLSPQERDRLLAGAPGYTNGVQNTYQAAPDNSMSFLSRDVNYNPYGGFPYTTKVEDQTQSSFRGYDSFEPLFGNSAIPHDQNYAMPQNNSQYFPTPPLSTHVPNFFDSSSYNAHTPNHRSVQTPRRLQFGSDARFEGQSFVAPPEQETPETLVKRKMNHLECLKPEESPASTHPSSPALQKKNRRGNYPEALPPATYENPQDEDSADTPEPKPRKRRKTNPDSDSDFKAVPKPTRQTSKRSKVSSAKKPPPAKSKPSREGSTSKSQPSSAKSNRQHLTDEQKKTNHIISEQKRRDLIKQGYNGIREMVPALKEAKYSKGAMLEAAADWLDDIVQCNQDLRSQLASLQGR